MMTPSLAQRQQEVFESNRAAHTKRREIVARTHLHRLTVERNYAAPVSYTNKGVAEVPLHWVAGVYLLCCDDGVYVGQSVNIMGRIFTHNRSGTFDRAFMLAEVPTDDKNQLLIAERRFITAAQKLGLALANTMLDDYRDVYSTTDLAEEISRLRMVLPTITTIKNRAVER
jgi:predicted GIY-YIG superfamily endonuclease